MSVCVIVLKLSQTINILLVRFFVFYNLLNNDGIHLKFHHMHRYLFLTMSALGNPELRGMGDAQLHKLMTQFCCSIVRYLDDKLIIITKEITYTQKY